MSERYVDLRDLPAVEDFIETFVEYLPAKDRKPYVHLVEDLQAGKKIKPERLAEMAKTLAIATWPARRALGRYLAAKGAAEEWEAVLKAVRLSTALLLKKLRTGSGAKTLDEALKSSDAGLAIHDAEEVEIDLVRPEVRLALWQEHAKKLAKETASAAEELEAIKLRLKKLRQASVASTELQRLLIPKLDAYEDRIYFGGEAVPLEVLDKELAFDAEDAAIPPTDDALSGAEPLPMRFVAEETAETGPVEEKKEEE